jgi:KDO2-lipid IV(A) lauroyltransferase
VSEAEIERLRQAHYAHLWRLCDEFLRFRWLSARRKTALVRVENVEVFAAALAGNKGVLVLTGHFGNWEVATVAGLGQFPQMHGRFHFVRRPIKPRWLDRFVSWRFQRAGFGVLSKRGSLDAILERLAAGDAIVFPFDQHRTASRSTSSAMPRGRSRASPSSRSPRARRWCRRQAGASPTAGTCSASRIRSRRSRARTQARRSGGLRARTTRCSSG